MIPSYEVHARNEFNRVRAANLQVVLEKIEAEKEALHKADEELFRDLKLIAGDAIRRSERATASTRVVYLRDMEGRQTDGG